MNIELIYCITDDFVKFCEKNFFNNLRSVGRKPTLSRSIYLTLAIIKQHFGFKTNRQLYDFVKEYMSKDIPLLPKTKRGRKSKMQLSEVMTIAIYYHYSGYKNFKSYYLNCV